MESFKTGRTLDRNIVNVIEEVRQDDIVVGIIGSDFRTNSFVELLTGENIQASTHEADIRAIRVLNFSQYGDKLVLILAPEFQDKSHSPEKMVHHIQRILKTMYLTDKAQLHGLLYLYSTADTHLLRSVTNIKYYRSICGTDSLKRIRLVLTNSPDEDGLAETFANGVWADLASRGSQIHLHKGDWGHREVESLISEVVGDAKEEDYAALKSDYDALVEVLEKVKIGKDVLGLLGGCFSQLHANIHDRSSLVAEYLRARDRFVRIAAIIRGELGIRSGERILTFLARKNPQFVTSGGRLRLHHRKPSNSDGSRQYQMNRGATHGGAATQFPPGSTSFSTRALFIRILRLVCLAHPQHRN